MIVSDVFTYLQWRGDLPFSVAEINAGDRLILSLVSFADFSGIVSDRIEKDAIMLGEAARRYLALHTQLGNMTRLMEMLANSRRFGELTVSGYVTRLRRQDTLREQTQFAAITFDFGDHLSVAYRGTDDTLVGWKENFNSLLLNPIPAQALAADYLERVSEVGLPLAVQGHSKGGNLAVYAAAASGVPVERILSVHDFDGPGFEKEFFETERYKALRPQIYKFMPEYSIIGLIRENDANLQVIKSTGRGLSQHNGFHFQLNEKGIVPAVRLDVNALLLNSRLKRCLGQMNDRQRKMFVESFYRLASSGGRTTVGELTGARRRLLRDFQRLEIQDKESVRWVTMEIFRQLFLGVQNNG